MEQSGLNTTVGHRVIPAVFDNLKLSWKIVTEIQKPNTTRQSLFCNFSGSDTPVLILSKVNRLEFHDIDLVGSSVKQLVSFPLENPIIAINKIHLKGLSNVLLALDNSWNLSIIYKQKDNICTRVVSQLSSEGQQFSIDSNPIIVTDKSSETRYFVLHNFQGVLSLFIINEDYDISPPKKKRSRSADVKLASVYSISIGAIVVLKMEMLENDILAVLYRDFNFTYSLRYYQIDIVKETITLIKNLDAFQVPPSYIIPTTHGGVLVLSSVSLFYFPGPNSRYLTLAETADASVTVSANVVTKDLLTDRPGEDMIGLFVAFDAIDDNRFLLTTNEGMTYLLYFDATTKNDTTYTVINHFQLITLGRTSSPNTNGLHHLTDSYFFQTSSSPSDILFQVNLERPFISILYSSEPRGPIIDMKYISSDSREDRISKLLTLRGNRNHSTITDSLQIPEIKLEVVSKTLWEEGGIFKITPILGTNEFICKSLDGKNGVFRYQNQIKKVKTKIAFEGLVLQARKFIDITYVVTSNGIYLENGRVLEAHILFAQILENKNIIYVTVDNEVVLYNDSEIVSTQKFGTEITRFYALKGIEFEIIYAIAKLGNKLELWSVSGQHHSELNETTSNEFVTSIVLDKQNNSVKVLYTTTDSLVQYSVDIKNHTLVGGMKAICHNFHNSKLEKSISNDMFIISQDMIYRLVLDATLNHYVPSRLGKTLKSSGIISLGNENFISLTTSGDILTLYKVRVNSETQRKDRIDAKKRKIFTKMSLFSKHYIVVLVKHESFDDSPIKTSIELYDLKHYNKLDSFVFDEQVVDMTVEDEYTHEDPMDIKESERGG
ncbi:hypothetical protein DFJ63DRAFT_314088 [Scheffersomyces coipomensis]|uniref:uncharacterized protein n=1 Tax=Scheffersomyces coipomensis TaxID=1788519 RepID=UPI00315D6094